MESAPRRSAKADRRHIERKTKVEVIKAVREMERARDEKKLRKPGQSWTVQAWLEHWVEKIAKPYVSENMYDGYEVDVRVYLVPGLGAHKLARLEPEHLERLYRRMQDSGSSAGTAHHVHRTVRVALGEAVRRGHVPTNVAEIAKAPRLHDARHTAATVLLILGVPDVVVDAITGWEPGGAARMRARYMHVTGTLLRKVARQVGDVLWEPPGDDGKPD